MQNLVSEVNRTISYRTWNTKSKYRAEHRYKLLNVYTCGAKMARDRVQVYMYGNMSECDEENLRFRKKSLSLGCLTKCVDYSAMSK